MSTKHYDWGDINNPPPIEEHSLVKHEMLASYLERYIRVLTVNPRQPNLKLWLIDGFAGGGKYRIVNNNQLHDGSPLILLKTIDKMRSEIQAERKKQFDINARYFFIEKEQCAFNFLRSILKSEGYLAEQNENITVVNNSFVDAFPDIFNKIKNEGGKSPRCIFLLDQYGYHDVPFNTLKTIFATFPETAEVLLTFATEHLIQYMSEKESFKVARKNAGLENVITDELIKNFRNTPSYEKKSARLLVEQMLATQVLTDSGARFFTPFFITSKLSRWSFLLVHLSCHWRARDEMSKIHWELHNYSHHYGVAGLKNFKSPSKLIETLGYDALHNEDQASLFEYDFDEHAEQRTYDALREELSEKIFNSREQKVTVGSLLLENCNYTPANSVHFKKTLAELINHKAIRIFSADGIHERFSANTIKNDDIIEFPQKTFFLPTLIPKGGQR